MQSSKFFFISKSHLKCGILLLCVMLLTASIQAQEKAYGSGFNYFPRKWFDDKDNGAGYTVYSAVWPIMQKYPGPHNFQLGLPSTWLTPVNSEPTPNGFYNTIEGGLGWWHDTRFATEVPKFIMGGVANGFSQWANGVGAGSGPLLWNGHRDWSVPSGKYGVAQITPNLLWPPDGLNMEQGANGEYLGYGYHPLPLTEEMETTYGVDFKTGNQCWTLFMNTKNFRGPIAFFLPTFWTETALDQPELEGLFLDTRPSDRNQAFAIEYAVSPALVGSDNSGNKFARVLPLTFPATTSNTSEVIRDIHVYSKSAKWNDVDKWFNGGKEATTIFEKEGTYDVFFNHSPYVDGSISSQDGSIKSNIDYYFGEKIRTEENTVAGFEWDTDVVTEENGHFVMPRYYVLQEDKWLPILSDNVPTETGLLTTEPEITPRNEVSYLTPLEADCPFQDPQSEWNVPGPSAGPFYAYLGDGSKLTYYWYKFIDQPAIVHAKLSEDMRQKLQERIEKIHNHWHYTDKYFEDPNGGELVGLDEGLIVSPPEGMEKGYVPIVTRQELFETATKKTSLDEENSIDIYPNPSKKHLTIASKDHKISKIEVYDMRGTLIYSVENLQDNRVNIDLENQVSSVYLLNVTKKNGKVSNHKILYIK